MLLFIVINPILSFLFIGLFGRFFGKNGSKFFACFNISMNMFMVILLSIYILNTMNVFSIVIGTWILSGNFFIEWGFLIDDLTILMLIIVNFISMAVHFYSNEYMKNDPHFSRFISYLTLFTFFMLILITANNFIQLFLGWEGVGLCSYLLISFWFTRIQANKSALKAIIVNRISDFGLSFGLILLLYMFATLDFIVPSILQPFLFTETFEFFGGKFKFLLTTIITLCLYFGAVGKSAQILLHTWLPDAMEGPTPVSALIHAATMVTAGVYLIIKCSNIFEFSHTCLIFIGFWGGLTSIFAATSGLFLSDIKKVIAYSTCSQLGYMVLVCAFSNYNVSLFHLMNHAIFKAALFLCAGSIIHALSSEQDIRRLGGLIKFLPVSYIVMLVASFAIAGFPFLTGFYSKDVIFETVFCVFGTMNIFIFWIISLTAVVTVIYSFRLIYFIFLSKNNGFRLSIEKIHESSFQISVVLVFLAFGSLASGFIFKDLVVGLGNFFLTVNIAPLLALSTPYDIEFIPALAKLVPFFIGFVGIFFLGLLIKNWQKNLQFYKKNLNFFLSFFVNKWYFDFIYNFFINKKILIFAKKVYVNLDKGLLEFFGPFGIWKILITVQYKIGQIQTGQLHVYMLLYSLPLLILFYIFVADSCLVEFSFFLAVLNTTFVKEIERLYKKTKLSLVRYFVEQRFLFWNIKNFVFFDYFIFMKRCEDPEYVIYNEMVTMSVLEDRIVDVVPKRVWEEEKASPGIIASPFLCDVIDDDEKYVFFFTLEKKLDRDEEKIPEFKYNSTFLFLEFDFLYRYLVCSFELLWLKSFWEFLKIYHTIIAILISHAFLLIFAFLGALSFFFISQAISLPTMRLFWDIMFLFEYWTLFEISDFYLIGWVFTSFCFLLGSFCIFICNYACNYLVLQFALNESARNPTNIKARTKLEVSLVILKVIGCLLFFIFFALGFVLFFDWSLVVETELSSFQTRRNPLFAHQPHHQWNFIYVKMDGINPNYYLRNTVWLHKIFTNIIRFRHSKYILVDMPIWVQRFYNSSKRIKYLIKKPSFLYSNASWSSIFLKTRKALDFSYAGNAGFAYRNLLSESAVGLFLLISSICTCADSWYFYDRQKASKKHEIYDIVLPLSELLPIDASGVHEIYELLHFEDHSFLLHWSDVNLSGYDEAITWKRPLLRSVDEESDVFFEENYGKNFSEEDTASLLKVKDYNLFYLEMDTLNAEGVFSNGYIPETEIPMKGWENDIPMLNALMEDLGDVVDVEAAERSVELKFDAYHEILPEEIDGCIANGSVPRELHTEEAIGWRFVVLFVYVVSYFWVEEFKSFLLILSLLIFVFAQYILQVSDSQKIWKIYNDRIHFKFTMVAFYILYGLEVFSLEICDVQCRLKKYGEKVIPQLLRALNLWFVFFCVLYTIVSIILKINFLF